MAIRSSMIDLIARTRMLIGDPLSDTCKPMFTDDFIQDFLDEERVDERYEVLHPKPTYAPGGIVWSNYYSTHEHWEANETLIWTNFTTLIPDTPTRADRIRGHWSFASSQLPAILIAGSHYDVWEVAANLLDIKIVNLAPLNINSTSDGQSFQAGAIITNLQAQAARYRAKAAPKSIRMVRVDVANPTMQERASRAGPVSAGVPFLTGE